jgi:hypothetical protein
LANPEPSLLPWLLNRIGVSAAIIAVSVAVHLGFVGAIVLAERRALPQSGVRPIDVDLVRSEELDLRKPEPPKPQEPLNLETPKIGEAKPPAPAKPAPQKSGPAKSAKAAPEPSETPAEAEPAAQKPAKPDTPSGGPPSESKSKLTPQEIADLRAQIQKCWKLPVGMPGVMGLEVVIRASFGPKGQLLGEPVLLQAPAHERGPVIVLIALNALKDCYPFRLPPAKYADWKVLDLKFTATGMAGLGAAPKLPKKL